MNLRLPTLYEAVLGYFALTVFASTFVEYVAGPQVLVLSDAGWTAWAFAFIVLITAKALSEKRESEIKSLERRVERMEEEIE